MFCTNLHNFSLIDRMGSFIPWNENPINIPRIPPTFPSNCNPDMTCCSVLTVLNRVFDMNPLVDSGNPNWIKTVNLEPWEEELSRVFSTRNSFKLQDFLQCLSWSFIIPSSSRWTHRRASELLSFSAWPEIFHYWPNSCIVKQKSLDRNFLDRKSAGRTIRDQKIQSWNILGVGTQKYIPRQKSWNKLLMF